MIDLRTYLQPELAKTLPRLSRERAQANLALKRLWHIVFDPCPRLLKVTSSHGSALFDPFLGWAAKNMLTLNWALHLHLLFWLHHDENWKPFVNEAHVKELMSAAAARWAKENQDEASGILIGSSLLPGRGIAAFKSSTAFEKFRVFLMRVPPSLTLPAFNAYILTSGAAFDPHSQWKGAPK